MRRLFFWNWLLFLSSLWVITTGCSASLPDPTTTGPAATTTRTQVPTSLPDEGTTPTSMPTFTRTPVPITPTPTSTPTLLPEFAALKIVYADQGYLWLWQNYVSTPLTIADERTTISISPDGNEIAFSRSQSLLVINTDGTGERVLVSREDLEEHIPVEPEFDPFLIDFQWIPDPRFLLLNTRYWGGPVEATREDLYLVDVQTGDWRALFTPGTGGEVYLSPDGEHIAVVSHTSIRLMDYDGSNRRTALTFEHVLYATDVPWYPEIFWEAGSASLLAVVQSVNSPADPSEPAMIWRIPLDGTPIIIAQTNRNLDPIFSPDLSRYSFIERVCENQRCHYELFTADLNGSNEQVYYVGSSVIYFVEWLQDSSGFVFRDSAGNTILIGNVGEPPRPLSFVEFPENIDSTSLNWIDSIHYIYWIYTREIQIWLGTVDGFAQPIINIDTPGYNGNFDFTRE